MLNSLQNPGDSAPTVQHRGGWGGGGGVGDPSRDCKGSGAGNTVAKYFPTYQSKTT